MKTYTIRSQSKMILSDTITPVSIYLKIRDIFPNSLLLEGADYHGGRNSYSFICIKPIAGFMVEDQKVHEQYPGEEPIVYPVTGDTDVPGAFHRFLQSFEAPANTGVPGTSGLFGYTTYDAVQYFDTIRLRHTPNPDEKIPSMRYHLYQYIIAINHFQNTLYLAENRLDDEENTLRQIESLLYNRNFAMYDFDTEGKEHSNLTDEEYMQMVSKGKEHCYRGDVFQIVLSRQFRQSFKGDEFNVYRTLRSINPSPYLFYFDYGNYRIFGSSPEAQLQIKGNKAFIHPIAGTFKRTGDDEKDKILAEELANDKKENAEHVMLVDLARNDLSRNATKVKVDSYREIQYYSHVLHMVSIVSGELPAGANPARVMADSFPAGTLSGAPKYKAMELIDQYENKSRGYYGGCIGYIGFGGDFNQAIMIRSFLSRNNTLYYQAGAGIVADSKEESELQEVNNKLAALKRAIEMAKEL